MPRPFAPTACLFLAIVLALLSSGGPAQAMTAKPRIAETPAFDAPIGDKGGIMTPIVACKSRSVEPRVRTVIEEVNGGYHKVFRYRGTMPGYGFPRVTVGDYKVTTTARCRVHTSTRREVVTVDEKTAERTVSRSEWKKIKRGMTVAEVRDLVGYNGTYAGRFGGKTSRIYDMMPFWRWSSITFRDGFVISKAWNVDHD